MPSVHTGPTACDDRAWTSGGQMGLALWVRGNHSEPPSENQSSNTSCGVTFEKHLTRFPARSHTNTLALAVYAVLA